jgi:hypothetical protein
MEVKVDVKEVGNVGHADTSEDFVASFERGEKVSSG